MKKSGPSFKFRSQRYWHDGTVDHETRDGRRIELKRLYTLCPGCGVGFHIQTTATAIKTRNLRRRCNACKHQGVPVEYRLPSKARRKRPEGAAKGNPRPGRMRTTPSPLVASQPAANRAPSFAKGAKPAPGPSSALVVAVEAAAAYRAAIGMIESGDAPPAAETANAPGVAINSIRQLKAANDASVGHQGEVS